ncbi:class I adenylate-forming enzyme family protein [uncultured Mitsuokella sp.]|uniref:class I adenylate-forming enzyme family protein n=1 Tax=uncultured Mitsuokella sp. TaxID=453120 RepID=UPI00261FD695|nr:AMP-binding protein [uncultured Mitsuokella sp.]
MLVHELLKTGRDEDPAVVDGGRSFAYAELRALTRAYRNHLYAQGIRIHDRVAIFSHKNIHYIAAYMAIASLGAVAVPINVQLSQREIGYILKDSGSSLLLTDRPFDWSGMPQYQDLAAAVRELAIDAYAETAAPEAPALPADFSSQQPCIIIYTSGTTGHPKGALLSHDNVTYNAQQVQDVLHIRREDRILCVLPLYHCFCLITSLMNPLLAGASIVLFDSYTLKNVVQDIRTYGLTVLYLVPSICSVLIQTASPEDLRTVRYTILGGTALPLSILKAFEEKFRMPIIEGYGLSEASPVVSVNPPRRVKPGSIGVELPGITTRIVDEQERDVAPGERGQLLVRGRNVMLGYWHRPKETAQTLSGGWLHTGDVVRRDEDGYLFIVDRIKELIISMGENIYPREIEELLYSYPHIRDAAVIGVPDKMRGHVGCCYYTVEPGFDVTGRELKKYLQQNLALYKVPRMFHKLESMPRLATGKIAKKALKDIYAKAVQDRR